jgi:hypothetical protein
MAHREGPFHRRLFDHRQHVMFAWRVLDESSAGEAAQIVGTEIRKYAAMHAPGKYHETMTQFWVLLVAHTRAQANASGDFEEHLARFAMLINAGAHKHHYSPAVLASERARREFVEPDLLPLP